MNRKRTAKKEEFMTRIKSLGFPAQALIKFHCHGVSFTQVRVQMTARDHLAHYLGKLTFPY